jgi:hypothetical protein
MSTGLYFVLKYFFFACATYLAYNDPRYNDRIYSVPSMTL